MSTIYPEYVPLFVEKVGRKHDLDTNKQFMNDLSKKADWGIRPFVLAIDEKVLSPVLLTALKTIHGTYVSAVPDLTVPGEAQGEPGDQSWDLRSNRSKVGGWETLIVNNLEKDTIAIKTDHGKFVRALPNGEAHADFDQVQKWERFGIEDLSDGWFAIKSLEHQTYLTAVPGQIDRPTDKPWTVACNRKVVRGWERFQFTVPDIATCKLVCAPNGQANVLQPERLIAALGGGPGDAIRATWF